MMRLFLVLLNLPLPALGFVLAGGFILLLMAIVLVVSVPSASERIIHFLALLKEVFYSGAMTKPSRSEDRLSRGDGAGECEEE